jgi:hypothetical protein
MDAFAVVCYASNQAASLAMILTLRLPIVI